MPDYKVSVFIDGNQVGLVSLAARTPEAAVREARKRITFKVGDQGPRGSRRLRSSEVTELAKHPEFQELVAPVQDGVDQQIGELVMNTVNQIAGPVEVVLDRPLEEGEAIDVQDLATGIVQDSLQMVTQEIAETAGPGEEAIEVEIPMEVSDVVGEKARSTRVGNGMFAGDLEEWVNAILQNDETATDAELVEHFISEGGLSQDEAEWVVSQRGQALGDRHYQVSLSEGPAGKHRLSRKISRVQNMLRRSAEETKAPQVGDMFDVIVLGETEGEKIFAEVTKVISDTKAKARIFAKPRGANYRKGQVVDIEYEDGQWIVTTEEKI